MAPRLERERALSLTLATACLWTSLAAALAVAASTSVVPPSALFCTSPGVIAVYYNNTELVLPVALTRTEPGIGVTLSNSGYAGVNTNLFSANWFGTITVETSGSYAFQYSADDGIRFFFQGARQPEVTGQWGTHAVTNYRSSVYPLVAGKPYAISAAYFQNGGAHQLSLYLLNSTTNQATAVNATGATYSSCLNAGEGMPRPVASFPALTTLCGSAPAGLTATFYADATFTTAVGSATVPNVDMVTTTPPSPLSSALTSYAVRYTGLLTVAQSDNYVFNVFYQDQFNVFINDNLIANGTAPSGPANATFLGTTYYALVAGQVYAFRAEGIKLNDGSPNFQFQVQFRRLTPPGANGFVTIPSSNFVACLAPGIVTTERFTPYSSAALTLPVSLRHAPASPVCLQVAALVNQTVDFAPAGPLCFDASNYSVPVIVALFPGAGTTQYSQVDLQVASSSDPLYPVGMDFVIELTRTTAALANGMGGGVCTVYGLGHIITFDGLVFTTAQFGDYYLGQFALGTVSIQGRMGPCGNGTAVACLQGLAIAWNSKVILLSIVDTLPVIWTNLDAAFSNGIQVQLLHGRDYTFTFPDHLVVQAFVRQYAALGTWALDITVAAPSAYAASFQSFRGLCGTLTSTAADDLLTFGGTLALLPAFLTAMQIPASASLLANATGPIVTTTTFATASAILVTARAVNSPPLPTYAGSMVTASITAYTALYAAPVSAAPSGAVSSGAPTSTVNCTSLATANLTAVCSAAGVPTATVGLLQSLCAQDAAALGASAASASTYNALYLACTFAASQLGVAPSGPGPLCPTLCFGRGVCIANGVCNCTAGFDLPDCSRIATAGPATVFVSPTHATAGALLRVHGSRYYMDPTETALTCTFVDASNATDVKSVSATSVTEFDATCTTPVGLGAATALVQVVRWGVAAGPGQPALSLIDFNPCASSNPCANGGACAEAVGTTMFNCTCAPGWTGATCSVEINNCASSPCLNGGTCTTSLNNFTCACAAGYTGETCEAIVNNCAANPCANGGACTNIIGVGTFSCACLPGYSGVTCGSEIDNCAPNPCQNGAICSTALNNFTCACLSGWTGPTCDTLVDNCVPNRCPTGFACINGVHSYSCCQTFINSCSANPCLNGGLCTNLPGISANYTCACAPGYTGPTCETVIDNCAPNPCQNGGTCANEVNNFTCSCPSGYSGDRCLSACALFVGGDFSVAGTTPASNIGIWTGHAWLPIGGGVQGTVNALASFNGDLYVGGSFEGAGGLGVSYLAKWNGTWQPVGAGLEKYVYALADYDGALYVGGMSSLFASSASALARWNGTAWFTGGYRTDNTVYALAMFQNVLYVGGAFDMAGNISVSNIAMWDGNTWSAVGDGVDSAVYALLVFEGALYVGGGFSFAGSLAVSNVALWDGAAWSALGTGLSSYVNALAVFSGGLYAGGAFDFAGDVNASYVAMWDGASWSAVGAGVNSIVDALAVYDGVLYAGGEFNEAGNTTATYIAAWNGSAWSPVGTGVTGDVYSMAVHCRIANEDSCASAPCPNGGVCANEAAGGPGIYTCTFPTTSCETNLTSWSFAMNGNASFDELGALVLTTSGGSEASSVFTTETFNMSATPCFDASFQVVVDECSDGWNCASGFAFVLQNAGPYYLGQSAGGLGFFQGPLAGTSGFRYVAVVGRTYSDFDSLGVYRDPANDDAGSATRSIYVPFASGMDLFLWVSYDCTVGELSVWLSIGSPIQQNPPVMVAPLSLFADSPSDESSLYSAGFTAGTGAAAERVRVLSAEFSTCTPAFFAKGQCARSGNTTCAHNPCQNGGLCVDDLPCANGARRSYNCVCAPGWTGDACENETLCDFFDVDGVPVSTTDDSIGSCTDCNYACLNDADCWYYSWNHSAVTEYDFNGCASNARQCMLLDGDGNPDWNVSVSTCADCFSACQAQACYAYSWSLGPLTRNSSNGCPATDSCQLFAVDGSPAVGTSAANVDSCFGCDSLCASDASCFHYAWNSSALIDKHEHGCPILTWDPSVLCTFYALDGVTMLPTSGFDVSTCADCMMSCGNDGPCYHYSWASGPTTYYTANAC